VSGHGWITPNPGGAVARCGGPALCKACAAESLALHRCARCLDDGMVCEDHPEFPWEGIHGTVEGHAEHGGIGMPCPACCSPIPEDGTRDIAEAFIPDGKRASASPSPPAIQRGE
jgi:hypothetical protein